MKPDISKSQPPSTPREWALYRAKASCRVGRDALDASTEPSRFSGVEYALFNLLHAVEEIADAMAEQDDGTNNSRV